MRLETLRKRHGEKVEKDASENLWALLGTSVHKVVEMGGSSSDLVEQHFHVEIGGTSISGTPDHFNVDTLELNDWKCTSIWTYIFGGRDEWEQALNVYRWMVWKKLGKLASKLTNHMIFRDHSRRDAESKEGYPPVPFASKDQEVWPIEQTEAFVMERLTAHEEAAELSDDKLPDCTADERWQKEDVWKVYKKAGAARAERGGVYNLEKGGREAAEDHANRIGGVVVHVPGKSVRCWDYCEVNSFCSQFQKEKKNAGC